MEEATPPPAGMVPARLECKRLSRGSNSPQLRGCWHSMEADYRLPLGHAGLQPAATTGICIFVLMHHGRSPGRNTTAAALESGAWTPEPPHPAPSSQSGSGPMAVMLLLQFLRAYMPWLSSPSLAGWPRALGSDPALL
jgi:hypothetical protein